MISKIFNTLIFSFLFWSVSSMAQSNQCAEYLINHPKLYWVAEQYDDVVNEDLIVPGSWAADFAYLALNDHLISQFDQKLYDMELIDPNGGLCGPTCVGNIAASLDFHSSNRRSMYWVENVHIFIDGLIRKYQLIAIGQNDSTGLNPLLGTHAHYFSSEYNDKNHEMGTQAHHISTSTHNMLNHYFKSADNISLGVVEFFAAKPRDGNPHYRHAIVILGINRVTKQIVVVDPNRSGEIIVSYYHEADGKINFSLNEEVFGLHEESYVRLDEILTFTDTQTIRPYRRRR